MCSCSHALLRSFINSHNVLVSVFLRTFECYRGIMILTINRVKDIDNAIQSRISVTLHYGPLGLDTRKTTYNFFFEEGSDNQRSSEIHTH